MSGSSGHSHSPTAGSPLSSILSTASSSTSQWSSGSRNLVYRDGSRYHSYSKEEVPYPFSLDRECLELNPLDHQLIYRMQRQLSFIDFKGNPPKRCLDLGTGFGDWVIEAARVWPESTFVGFDIADVQIKLEYVEEETSRRIRWEHGNILQPLPFDDSEFDYVHMSAMAFAVPEYKWHAVFDEISRIVKPGGYVEDIEEDALFPVLPRWFTAPLHERHASGKANTTSPPLSEELPHDHALLELLFNSVFENRFINPVPSSILPGYFSATFKHVISPPILYFPMPPLAPLQPFSRESLPEPIRSPGTMSPRASSPPPTMPAMLAVMSLADQLPPDRVVSPPPLSKFGRRRGLSTSTTGSGDSDSSRHSSEHSEASSHTSSAALPMLAEQGETIQIGGAAAYSLYNMEVLTGIDDHTLFVHLHRATGLVWGVKEAMWDELKALVDRHDPSLVKYGWRQYEYTEALSKRKFNALWDRYRADIHERMAMWHPMTHYGWSYPRQSAMTEEQILEREQLREAILEARVLAKEEEIQPLSRVIRLLVGVNEK